ncbi:hypothetical protein [Flavobacterium hungaricum]|uniref:Uncharacterized protein n=1 Tax=Flavobacterium hungaricum TaxID=2082725 RepID=A0ABR9TL79_9FLAO|nr:hypothetical protein [Flavobacterium hungaricum]MBE8725794.1 hypothetical protein [Flavobacterium hungaricum]
MNNLPKLDFLYFNLEFTDENYFKRKELYYAQTDWDERHFEDYVETCSFEELIYLMVYTYKDKYPRDKFYHTISLDSDDKILLSYTNENGRLVTEDKSIYNNFFRKEVIGMVTQFYSEQYTDEEMLEKFWSSEYYMQNLFLEFDKEIPFEIIDKALAGKEYTKTQKEKILIYEIKDSPIASLEITKKSVKLNINEDKVIIYMPLY